MFTQPSQASQPPQLSLLVDSGAATNNTQVIIPPPRVGLQQGAGTRKRIKGIVELTRKKKKKETHECSFCKMLGHNKGKCKELDTMEYPVITKDSKTTIIPNLEDTAKEVEEEFARTCMNMTG